MLEYITDQIECRLILVFCYFFVIDLVPSKIYIFTIILLKMSLK